VLLDDERDAVTGEVLPRKLRALIKRGELGQLTQPGRRDGSVLVLSGNIYRSGLSQGAHTPSQESYLIGLPISALMHRSAKKGGTDLLGQQVLHEFPDQIFGVVLETLRIPFKVHEAPPLQHFLERETGEIHLWLLI